MEYIKIGIRYIFFSFLKDVRIIGKDKQSQLFLHYIYISIWNYVFMWYKCENILKFILIKQKI